MKTKRLIWWSTLVASAAAVVLIVVPWYAEKRVREILEPYVANTKELDLDVDLFVGSFVMNDVELSVPAGMYPRAPLLRGRVDLLSVSGISVLHLLFERTFEMDEVRIRASEILVDVEPRDTTSAATGQPGKKKEHTILIGRFDLQFTSLACRTFGTDTAHYSLDTVLLAGSDFKLDLHGDDPFPHFTNSSVLVSGFQMARSSGYVLDVGRATAERNGAALLVTNIAFHPTKDLKAFGSSLDFERDAFDLRSDSVALVGFDLERWYATNVLSARSLRIANADVIVLRDKTLRDEPSSYKPLLGTLIRKLPPGSGADTVVLSNWRATYKERADRDRGFATIPFTSLNALLTGVKNTNEEHQPMVIDARCKVFGDTPVTLHLTTDVHDSTDRFVVDGRLGYMHFPAMNVASSPMFDVRAAEGHMRSLVFHMDANDRRAHGTVAMHYDGIKLSGGRLEKDRTTARFYSAMMNALVRNDSKGAKGKDRIGTFAFERQRDRAIFNYMWSGLREGSKSMLLPKALTK